MISLSESRRCPKEVCKFVAYSLSINISANINNKSGKVEFINDDIKIDEAMRNDSVMKLFYQKSTSYNCVCRNWGESKGTEYNRICVILNKTTYEQYRKSSLDNLATSTKAKLYVACTRTLEELYSIPEFKVHEYREG
ncbi:hypothetical protein ScFU97_18510 [Streptococcus canis]|nr:hypothetical protein ScFU97_18510 [Streptococcus canis]VTR79093.1 Uncharacterised protein [Streptococcus canis]